jgi:hypothetical protein
MAPTTFSAQRFVAYTPLLNWAFPHSSPGGRAAVIDALSHSSTANVVPAVIES